MDPQTLGNGQQKHQNQKEPLLPFNKRAEILEK